MERLDGNAIVTDWHIAHKYQVQQWIIIHHPSNKGLRLLTQSCVTMRSFTRRGCCMSKQEQSKVNVVIYKGRA